MTTTKKTIAPWLPWVICGLAALFYCYEYFLRVAPSVMNGDLMRTYDVSAEMLGTMVGFYYNAYTPMQLPVGVLMDRYGPRRLLTLAALVCAVGSFLFAATASLAIATLGRFLVGFGSAFAFVGVLKLARIWLPVDRFAMMSGIASALGVLGALTGEVLLTPVVEIMGWRHASFFSAFLGVLLAVVIYLVIRDHNPAQPKSKEVSVTDVKQVLADLVTIVIMPRIWVIGFVGCFLYLPTSAFAELWIVPYLEQARNFTLQQAAWGASTIFIGWGIMGPIVGYISDRINRRRAPMLVGALLAIFFSLILIYMPGLPKSLIYLTLFLFGASYSVQVIVFAAACDIAPKSSTATAIALTNMVVMLSGNLFQPIIGKLLDLHWDGLIVDGVRIFSESNYQFALAVVPLSLLNAFILALFLPKYAQKPASNKSAVSKTTSRSNKNTQKTRKI
ncbi:MAG: MFS transporter [Gammaproteobacteria bacterium]